MSNGRRSVQRATGTLGEPHGEANPQAGSPLVEDSVNTGTDPTTATRSQGSPAPQGSLGYHEELERLLSTPTGGLSQEELDALIRRIKALKDLSSLSQPGPRPERGQRGSSIDDAEHRLDLLVKNPTPKLEGISQSHLDAWVSEIEYTLTIHRADWDCQRRTTWVVRGLLKHRSLHQHVQRRLNDTSKGPLLWQELKGLVQDQVRDPVIHVLENALAYHGLAMQEGDKFIDFYARVKSHEDRFPYAIGSPEYRLDWMFTRLPPTIRKEFIRQAVRSRVTREEDFVAEVQRIEQTLAATGGPRAHPTGLAWNPKRPASDFEDPKAALGRPDSSKKPRQWSGGHRGGYRGQPQHQPQADRTPSQSQGQGKATWANNKKQGSGNGKP